MALEKIKEDTFSYNEFVDVYIIRYDNVGIDKYNNITDYIKVVSLPNSKEIITIFPYDKSLKKEKTKVKELTRIDKFNLKYGMK